MSTKEDATYEAVEAAKRNYGQEIDLGTLIEELEQRGWRYEE